MNSLTTLERKSNDELGSTDRSKSRNSINFRKDRKISQNGCINLQEKVNDEPRSTRNSLNSINLENGRKNSQNGCIDLHKKINDEPRSLENSLDLISFEKDRKINGYIDQEMNNVLMLSQNRKRNYVRREKM